VTDNATKLVLRATGGFTGPAGAQTRSADLSALPAAAAQPFQQLLQESDFFALPDTLSKPAPQSWDFQYTLQVQSGGRSKTVNYYLDAAPKALQKLTAALEELPPD
jgi:hypothetical protein